MNADEQGEYREYQAHHVDRQGQMITTTMREWLHPKTNKQRQDNARVRRWRARFEPMFAGLTAQQRRNRKRRISKAFKIQQFKKKAREEQK
jgi:hypothetical protein